MANDHCNDYHQVLSPDSDDRHHYSYHYHYHYDHCITIILILVDFISWFLDASIMSDKMNIMMSNHLGFSHP